MKTILSFVFYISFLGLILVMAILEAFTSIIVRNQKRTELNHHEFKIRNGNATFKDRIWIFATSIIRNVMVPVLMIPSLVITFIAWIIIEIFMK